MDLTIVIPVLNRRGLVRRTIESIRRSPIWPVSIIAVDNGSTDGTLEALEQYAGECSWISVLHEPSPGAAAARNRGLAAVTTTWVYFFDSDDLFEDLPHEWKTDVDMVAFPTRQKVNDRETVRAYRPVSDPAVHILNSMLNTISMIFRTSWLRGTGGWNPSCRIWDDWELGLRALLARPRLQWITARSYHCTSVSQDSITGPSLRSGIGRGLDCMKIALDECASAPVEMRSRCLEALKLRVLILSGKLLHEGDKDASRACRDFISGNSRLFGKTGLKGKILEFYSSLGGRGAWKMALASLKKEK